MPIDICTIMWATALALLPIEAYLFKKIVVDKD